ncbi:hypothetical protein PT285_07880 [Lactobacillus sp. ESL0791]|uniref:hypothetical protein n=1 Tax=Lactobacillus sp. ESL0791 TaxID=2983234 RepID=UPI0023F9DBD6|nr:hypothetical protein [Lactobacillus sp. ESL0791]MDF7639317.1 hypothetical protein [Lactobacillus sp. ESL0791]
MKKKARKILALIALLGINSLLVANQVIPTQANVKTSIKKEKSHYLKAFPKKMRGTWYSYIDDRLDKITITKTKLRLKNGNVFNLVKKAKSAQGKQHYLTAVNKETADGIVAKGKNKYVATKENSKAFNDYRMDRLNGQQVLLVGCSRSNNYFRSKKAAEKYTKTYYQQATLMLPKNYSLAGVRKTKVSDGQPDKQLLAASKKGMKISDFNRTAALESASDKQLVDPGKLTADQQIEINAFTLRLINQARSCLKLQPWRASTNTQKLATDIASTYNSSKKKSMGVDPALVTSVGKANGLNLTADQGALIDVVQSEGATGMDKISLAVVKKIIYRQIKDGLFGYYGMENGLGFFNLGFNWRFSDAQRELNNSKNYRGYMTNLLNADGNNYDGDFDYFGFSISNLKGMPDPAYEFHFVCLPSRMLEDKSINVSFKP